MLLLFANVFRPAKQMRMLYLLGQTLDFVRNLPDYFSMLNLVINAENNENLPAELFGKVRETCFHSFGGGIVAEIRFCGYGLDLNAECFFTYPTQIVNIACMVKFGVAFLKTNVRKLMGKIVPDY